MFLRGMTKMALCAEITVMNTGGNVVLSPSHQVLVRTEGIQFGLDSARAGIFPAPRELIDALVPILRSLREPRAKGQIISELTSAGLHPVAARGLMEDLLTHGVIRTQGKPHTSAVIGDDPLADAISDLLGKSGMNILRSTNFPSTEEFMDHIQRQTLVIVCNPRGIESGVEDRVNTHGFLLPVRLIDAHGIIGPVRIRRKRPVSRLRRSPPRRFRPRVACASHPINTFWSTFFCGSASHRSHRRTRRFCGSKPSFTPRPRLLR